MEQPAQVHLPASTLDGIETTSGETAALWGRRGMLALIAVFVGLGLVGVLGVRLATATSSSAGWTLQLRYAEVSRAGLDTPWTVTVHHDGGFSKPIVLGLTGDYFDIYETQGFHPQPSAETRDGDDLYLTFDPPPAGETFQVAYDAYIQPASQQGRSATLSILVDDVPVTSLDFATHLVP